MKISGFYHLFKFVVFIIAGVLLLVFSKALMENKGAILNGVVGCVIAVYGLEGIIVPLVTKKIKDEKLRFFNGWINLLIAVIMIFFLEGHAHELRVICVIWSLWSIMREGEEILEKCLEGIKEHPIVSAINFAESVVVIVFSIMLIAAKDEHELIHHAYAHVVLLSIELIIEVVWVYAAELESRLLKRIKDKRAKND